MRLRHLAFAAAVCLYAAAPLLHSGVAEAQQPPMAPPAAPSAPGMTTDQAVASVQAFYDNALTFKAGFAQKFWVKAYNQTKDSHGTVIFKKPGKMRWNYDDPAGNVVVSDGKQLQVYEASNKQEYIQDVNASQYPAALSFLTGTGRLANSFDFDLYSGDRMNFPGGYVLVGSPKQSSSAYTKVLFYVDAASSQVRRVLIVDGQGNKNRFDFSAPRINEQVTEDTFVFHPPSDTNIVH